MNNINVTITDYTKEESIWRDIESDYPIVRDGGSVTASQLPPQPTPEQQFEQFMIKNGINTVNLWD